ncbi:hypothetical protein [Vagococcus intermedius]|uniref:Uncharacterized protein n=1 Tax=Vagococcus intermedius TaxID=2991418 RepID=A0AAF0CUY9_9ENTE|nr:hypothetical protein [Vagococcus intermedius]WEG73495.1 hypothetical protein OL234_00885 [Vagococcus intermedius]WEG75577.1 hypothetical protein OL235_00890 [Vagococcus intermedius]
MNQNQNEQNINTKGEYAKYVFDQIEHVFPDYFSTISSLEVDCKPEEFAPYLEFMNHLLNAYQLVQYHIVGVKEEN